ncbi:MAG: DNA mismatch repair endonuclease MutL [Bacteroidota bacterium]
MPKLIKILPPELASKIAAGEVVQRPASALKELLENALDANAKNITVIINGSGKTLIRIIDDGTGMGPEDAVLAFQRHATSKISSVDDLENIRSFGFRGEALAAISSVSMVEMHTRTAKSDVATLVRVEGGIVIEIGEDAAPVGTSVAVKNLFYNTPGRRNFLKSDETEFRHIFDAAQRTVLAHPELGFKFVSNDETLLQLRPGTLQERVKDIFGEKQSSAIFPFEEETSFAKIHGFLGKPEYGRKTRTEQYLYLNNRYIVNRSISHAVLNGYEHMLEKGSFPFFILFIEIDPRKVDVNVHPAKMEVKFADEQAMYRFVMSAVRHALTSQDLLPSVGMRDKSSTEERMGLKFTPNRSAGGDRVVQWRELLKGDVGTSEQSKSHGIFDKRGEIDNKAPNLPREQTSLLEQAQEKPTFGIKIPLWQIHNKYIIMPTDEGVMLIDQHAAHERVIYERVIERFEGKEGKSQQLLFPQTIELTPGDAALVRQILLYLQKLGFSIKLFGQTTVIIDGIPTDVRVREEGSILKNVLDLFKENEHDVKNEPRERLAKVYSCKAAIKSGDPLNDIEMRSLLDQLFATKLPYTCPHGRPVIIKLSLSELDKRFGRTPV